MASLLELSHELLHCIFVEIEPADLAALCRTCRTLNAYIRGNKILHKELYIRRYDDPALCEKREPDWENDVQNAIRLDKILNSEDREVKKEEMMFVTEQMNRLLETAQVDSEKSLNVQLLSDYFSDRDNCDVFLCASSLWRTVGSQRQRPASTPEMRQASAKLHCLYGKDVECGPGSLRFLDGVLQMDTSLPPSAGTRAKEIKGHMVARAKVYDLREYTDDTRWGPFMNDGSQNVDWEKVEAVMMVLAYNLNKFTERSGGRFPLVWNDPFVGVTPKSFISPSPTTGTKKVVEEELTLLRELAPSIDLLDPYGVTGSWMRVVCFLDFHDLYAFNFNNALQVPHGQPRVPIDIEEAIRLIRIKLQVTHIDPPDSIDEDDEEYGMDWSNFKGVRLPVVHFQGNSRSLHASWDPNANSRIRGSVRQTPEGEIRWTTFSFFHGTERWRSEGIQVGGLRSARGVLGNWFDKDYSVHGPAGPTAFWKETDDLEEEHSSSWLPH